MVTVDLANSRHSERSVMGWATGRMGFAADFAMAGTESGPPNYRALPGILVIDKDPDVCAALVRWLNRQGLTVWAAHDEYEAAALYRNHRGAIGQVIDHLRLRCLLDAPFEPAPEVRL
jgi:hypothetical protein